MSKIKLLSPQEASKIAAGEVVEHPANVVKELVENAVDAGATKIEIYLEQAGKRLIRIIDNGCGMSPEDAQLCFQNHATSKLEYVVDLPQVQTFGFRGEALSSIAAVSKVSLVTKEASAVHGTLSKIEGGIWGGQAVVACETGTDLKIADLFYNLPARQKFLKKDEVEWRQILQLFQAFVLAYPKIHFRLMHDDRQVHNCPAVTKLVDRIAQLWEASLVDQLLLVSNLSERGSVSGLISNHQVFRYNRAQIFCFVNRRLVKNYALSKAIINGYANVLPEGRYPVAVLMIEVPFDQLDVNVHPRKEEVSFLHPRVVEQLISEAVKQALEQNISRQIASPQDFNRSINYGGFDSVAAKSTKFTGARFADFDFDSPVQMAPKQPDFGSKNSAKFNDVVADLDLAQQIAWSEPMVVQQTLAQRDYEIIGQLHRTYILISKPEGLVIVDQHAAHERVMYEKFKSRFEEVVTVQLMFPVMIMLSESDLQLVLPHLDLLVEHGVEIESFGVDQLIVQSIPAYLKQVKLDELIHQLIAWIQGGKQLDAPQLKKQLNEHLQAQMACKAAVKAGDTLTIEQMYELLDDLNQTENKLTCPHGRPVAWNFTLNELEKKFKRKL